MQTEYFWSFMKFKSYKTMTTIFFFGKINAICNFLITESSSSYLEDFFFLIVSGLNTFFFCSQNFDFIYKNHFFFIFTMGQFFFIPVGRSQMCIPHSAASKLKHPQRVELLYKVIKRNCEDYHLY